MIGVGPLAQSGLDEAFGFAVGLGGVGASAAVLQTHLLAGAAKMVGAIATAVIGPAGRAPGCRGGRRTPARRAERQ